MLQNIGGFHWESFILNWVGDNLNCIDDYAALKWANDSKLDIFAAKQNAGTYSELLTHSNDCVSI